MKTGWLMDLSLLMVRGTVGLYLCLAGVAKVGGELQNGIGSFQKGPFTAMQPGWLPGWFAAPYGYVLPWAEVLVGALLVLGLVSRVMAAGTFMMLLSFTIALAMLHGIDAQPDGPPGPFSANYVQIAAAFLLIWTGPGRWSLDGFVFKKRG
ncbi:MAG: MauE/DoxX family redox-associated membrane protein [Planctomycetota bacterium]